MSQPAASAPRVRSVNPAAALPGLAAGTAVLYLSLVVLLPLAALVWQAQAGGWSGFLHAVRAPDVQAALKLSISVALIVVVVNSVFGTILAWVLVRDDFPGKSAVNAVVDLPFALPTIVVGVILLLLYGPSSPIGIDVAYTRKGIVLALMFETLPFVVRSVQPVLLELDREMEQAAASLGAAPLTVFRRIVLPNLLPAILSGGALAFAKALGEYGSVVLISGNVPFSTQVVPVLIKGRIESDDQAGAAAISLVLLILALVILLGISLLQRWGTRHDR
ncbi:MAG TPA: sulfate ABC transporter permease subunit CysT [Gaiellales bacterium]|nr:sulfate ABC transporter permease subunit CysT [Gaiellales bacterium]